MQTLLDAGEAIIDSAPFTEARSLPQPCVSCAFVETCQGGCSGRRKLLGQIAAPDPYCPILRGETRKLNIRMASARDLPKLESACTTIVLARD